MPEQSRSAIITLLLAFTAAALGNWLIPYDKLELTGSAYIIRIMAPLLVVGFIGTAVLKQKVR